LNEALSNKGYEMFLPTHSETEGTRRRPRVLFPGYLFCRVDPRLRLPILTTPGVIGFAGMGKILIPVPDDEIDRIRTVVASGFSRQSIPLVAVGERVRVIEGALRGLEGIIQQEKSRCRVVIAVTLLQRSVAVDVDRDWIEPVASLGEALRSAGGAMA
jgi:transcriptional antiterminator NusG